MYLQKGYADKDLKTLLLESLGTFGRLNENFINNIVAIHHYLGKVDAGRIRLSQSDVYSLKWEANIADLRDEGLVKIEQKGYREYFLVKKEISIKKFKATLEEIKGLHPRERRKFALYLHYLTLKNQKKNNQKKLQPTHRQLRKLISDMRGGCSTSP